MKMVVVRVKGTRLCKFLSTLICCGVLLSACPRTVLAQPAIVIISVNVTNLHPYTAETKYMSLVGYYRTLVHTQTGIWLTYEAAERLVKQLGGR